VSDDFQGVPTGWWRELDSRSRLGAWLGLWAIALFLLLLLALNRKGVLSYADLLPVSDG
jgi:hypothetical protein